MVLPVAAGAQAPAPSLDEFHSAAEPPPPHLAQPSNHLPPCTPTSDTFDFDGYHVRLCYWTPDGRTGQGRAGIWSSGQAGLFWFFDRGNAEALVKVLDGCAINGHRWVFFAPVTDLGLTLWITDPRTNRRWSYVNPVGRTAPTAADTTAFPCTHDGDPVGGRVLFSEDYESHAVGSLPDGYVIVFDGRGTSEQRVEAESGNKHLRTAARRSWSLTMRKDLDADLPRAISVTWRMRVDEDVDDYGYTDPEGARYAHFGGFGIKNKDEIAATVGVHKYESDRRIVPYCRGGASRPALELGQWAAFRMDIDFSAGRYALYMRGQKLCENDTHLVDLSGTWNSWGDSAGIFFGSGNSGNTTTRFDDIVIRAAGSLGQAASALTVGSTARTEPPSAYSTPHFSRGGPVAESPGEEPNLEALNSESRSHRSEWAESELVGISSAASRKYRLDDGTFESHVRLVYGSTPAYDQEYAQLFRLNQGGTLAYVEVCVERHRETGAHDQLPLRLNLYLDSSGTPGRNVGSYDATVTERQRATSRCHTVRLAPTGPTRVESGAIWAGVSWRNSIGMYLGVDRNGPGGGLQMARSRRISTHRLSEWLRYQDLLSDTKAFGIRIGVDHSASPPTACTPTSDVFNFDGHRVRLCYRTPDGRTGEGRSGIWASGQAGLFWFFDRGNAEALIKVLDGCAINGHRWVFFAPVTDVGLHLRVTDPHNRTWTYTNPVGRTAPAAANTKAFSCDAPPAGPDLVVSNPSVSNARPNAGARLTIRATVRNQGSGRSASTTLRYYRSSDSRITRFDAEVGTDAVGALSASASSAESLSLTAPSGPGTWYYGVCVDAVPGESNKDNNCSRGVQVTVGGAPDLIVEAPESTRETALAGQEFSFAATVRNRGKSRSSATTLRYYRSSDSRITRSDTLEGSVGVGALSPSGAARRSIDLRVPSSPGTTYYYGACVDDVAGESNTGNNCSAGVAVRVSG